MGKFKYNKSRIHEIGTRGKSLRYHPGDAVKLRTHPVTQEIAPALYREGEFVGWFSSGALADQFFKKRTHPVWVIELNPPKES